MESCDDITMESADGMTAIDTNDCAITHIGIRFATRSEAITLGVNPEQDALVYVVTRSDADEPTVVLCSTHYIKHRGAPNSSRARSLIIEQIGTELSHGR